MQAMEEVARAHIKLKNSSAALQILRELIWMTEKKVIKNLPGQLQSWRQLIIQAYLVDGNIVDAELAMLRYQQDHASPTEEWKRARATVLILAGKPQDAVLLLAGQRHMHSRTIYYLAKLLSGKSTPTEVLKNTRKLASNKTFSDSTRRQFWLVATRAALRLKNDVVAIDSLQRALMLLPRSDRLSQNERLLFDPNVMDLWTLYTSYGVQLTDKWKISRNDDTVVFTKASNLAAKKPIQALALSSLLINNSENVNSLRAAHELFVTLINDDPQGLLLLQHIYLHESMSKHKEFIPEHLRLKLIDAALSDSDIQTASELIQTVNKPPVGEDAVYWKLRKARIMLLAGEQHKSTQLLRDLIKDTAVFQVDQMDRLMQVLFDLQTIGLHRDAIELFTALPMQGQTAQRQRELHYWIAESFGKINEFLLSARHFLLSAGLFDANAQDPWAQTARYQAAQMLVKGQAYQDAGRIYNNLLNITKDPGRRAVLQNKIQQLWLQSNEFSGLRQLQTN